MAKCHRNDVASVVLDRTSGGGSGSFRLWTAFSGASFRRMLLDTMRCGGTRYLEEITGADQPSPENLVEQSQRQRSESRSEAKKKNAGSEKLSELLRLSESSEAGLDCETAEEVKRKVDALEEMKRVVKRLQSDDVLGGAIDVRRLTKENLEARTNLALLGAIPPLVALLDSEDLDAQIASLYALLNLGIGNDA